jgi:UDP-3-O-[3-hydroxymyristoyl] glucosamine N-acyltransferase
MPHFGGVQIGDDVEIGANTCVDRSVFGETVIERMSRLDNLVQVAHSVRIGSGALLAAFTGIAGGAQIGRETTFGGRTSVVDGVRVGDGAVLLGSAAATKNVAPGAFIGGVPGQRRREWLRQLAALRSLPKRLRDWDRWDKRLAVLEERLGGAVGHRGDQADSSAP